MRDRQDNLALAFASGLIYSLWRYRQTGDPWALDEAFADARAAARALRAAGGGPVARTDQPRWLVQALPAAGELAELAAGEAERAADASLAGLWRDLGLRSQPPAWTEAECGAARSAVLVALADPEEQSLEGMRAALRRIGAGRVGSVLADELRACREHTWRIVLGERYASVAHRCAPRTRFRTLGLRAVFAADDGLREAFAERLARWVRMGARRDELPSAVEAVLVTHRTPDHVA